jgi:hypothetical protein
LNDFKNELKYQIEALEMTRRYYKNVDHPSIAISLCNVGNAFGHIKDYQNQLSYNLEALNMLSSLYKNNENSLLTTINSNVGIVYGNLGK